MVLDDDLARSGRAIAAAAGKGAGPTSADLRRRRRRGRLAGSAAVLVTVALSGIGLWTVGEDRPSKVDTADETPSPRIEVGAGPTTLRSADGQPVGVLGPTSTGGADPVVDQVLAELLDGPAASRLAALGVTGSRDARAGILSDAGLVIETTVRSQTLTAAKGATAALPPDGSSAALVSVDPTTGEIVALAGATSVLQRQPGHAYLPIVMAAALEAGVPADEEIPAPAQVVSDGTAPWRVTNFDNQDLGPLTLGEALARSASTPWATLVNDGRLDPEHVAQVAQRLGIPVPSGTPMVPAMVLGVLEVNPVDLTRAYTTFARAGRPVELHIVRRVLSPGGEILYNTSGQADADAVIDPAIAVEVRGAMEQAICCGTGAEAALSGGVAQFGTAGSTGRQADAWFAGSTPALTTVVWVGRLDRPEPIPGLTGGGAPARVWKAFMEASSEQGVAAQFPR